MTEVKRPLKVFLCHASADKPRVRELYRTLKRRGMQPWLDAEDLIPGQNWEVEIPKAILSSDAIIICLTPNSVDKEGYVQKEIKFALDKAMEIPEGRIFLIPARLEDCELPFSLRKYQAVNLYEKAGYTKLMQALKLRASQLERATVELPKAGETTAEIKKVIEEKNPPEPKEEKHETKTPGPSQEKVGVGGDVKDSVIVAGSGNVINIGEQKKPEPEKSKLETPKIAKPEPKKTVSPRKPNTAIIVALIGLVGTICAAIISSPILSNLFLAESTHTPTQQTPTLVVGFKTPTLPFNSPTETLTPNSTPTIPTISVIDQPVNCRQGPDLGWKAVSALNIGQTSQIVGKNSDSTWWYIVDPLNPGRNCWVMSSVTIAEGDLLSVPVVAAPSLQTEITDAQGIQMVLVPASEFTMGSENGRDDEKPVRQVYLDAFYMDIYEVTNAAFKVCVEAGGCTPPEDIRSYTHSSYYGNLQYDDYPVIYVNWNQAQSYCQWRGATLPTEAQWEKAARGTDERTYPWGEGISCSQANYGGTNGCVGDTTEVGSYEGGKSPYGMYDMGGNVWEWVGDWYDSSYYVNSPSSNPSGPSSGIHRVLRGGTWSDNDGFIRSASRAGNSPADARYYIGFRCAKDAIP